MQNGSNPPLVLVATMTERTSKTGKRYFSGFLGKAKLVAFLDGETDYGPLWKLFVQSNEPRQDGRQVSQEQPATKTEKELADLFHKPL